MRIDWQKRAVDARARMEMRSSDAEVLFNRAMRTRNKRLAARIILEAEKHAAAADRAYNDWLNALEKLTQRERRRERYERQQLKKYHAERKEIYHFFHEEWEEFRDDVHTEWEFGAEYDAISGPDSDVDVNFRVVRADGRAFDAKQATLVMQHVREKGEPPVGYVLHAVQWRSPEKRNSRWKSSNNVGEVIQNLGNVMDALAKQPHSWRLGAPKD